MEPSAEVEYNQQKFIAIIARLFELARIVPGERPELDPEARTDVWMISLPLYLYTKVMKMLVPAEAALRRLIIMAAQGLDFTPPTFRIPAPRKDSDAPVVDTALPAVEAAAPEGGSDAPAMAVTPSVPAFQMFDPLKTSGEHDATRITGLHRPFPGAFPPARGRFEPVNAVSLWQRINALSQAFNTLPDMAKKYLTWQARSEHAHTHKLPLRPNRVGLLQPLYLRRHIRKPRTGVHVLLQECHLWAQDIALPLPWRETFALR